MRPFFLLALLSEPASAEAGFSAFLHSFEQIFGQVIALATHITEIMGVVVLVIGAVKAFVAYFTKRSTVRLDLAQSMALALEFKLGGEILRTVVARDWNEILTVGAIIILRGVLNFLIHWEIGNIQHDAQVVSEQERHPTDAGAGGRARDYDA
jgi:uncharacterized membrane protein